MVTLKSKSIDQLVISQKSVFTLCCELGIRLPTPYVTKYAIGKTYHGLPSFGFVSTAKYRGWKRNHWTLNIHDSCLVLPH